MVAWYHWVAFLGFLGSILSVDLLVLNRRAHEVPFKEAMAWTAAWVGLAAAFGAVVWLWRGEVKAEEKT